MNQPLDVASLEVSLCRATSPEELAALVAEHIRHDSDAERAAVWLEGADQPVAVAPAGAEPPSEAELASAPRWSIELDGHPRGEVVLVDPQREPPTAPRMLPLAAVLFDQLGNYKSLEMLVEQEMTAAVEREMAMRLVLDSMQDGLLVCDLDGRPTDICSANVESWLGPIDEDTRVWSYLARGDEERAATWQVGFEQLFEDFLPFEVSAGQLPSSLERNGRIYAISVEAVREGEALSQVVVGIADVTERLAAERREAEKRELVGILQAVVANRTGFMAFAGEMRHLLDQMARTDEHLTLKRILHTIKGSTAVYGFHAFSQACHALEDQLADDVSAVAEGLAQLQAGWGHQLARIEAFVSPSGDTLTVHSQEVNRLLEALGELGLHDLRAQVYDWKHDRVGELLAPLAQQAEALAQKRGKDVDVHVSGGDVRLPSERLRPFVSNLVHVIRNAVDHGIEPPEERRKADKSSRGRIAIEVSRGPSHFEVTVADDGRGLMWDRLRAVAEQRGLPHADRRDLLGVIFTDGASTAEGVTEVSGRGVGMAAVKAACEALGGTVSVSSVPGQGTRFTFAFRQAKRFVSLMPPAPR